MTSKIDAIQEGIAANLTAAFPTIDAKPYFNPNPNPPCFDMMPDGVEYDLSMARGTDRYQVIVRLMVPWNDPVGQQTELNSFLDPTGSSSVKTAIESDRTLGGAVAWCRVTAVTAYKQYPHRQMQAADMQMKVGVEFTVEAMT